MDYNKALDALGVILTALIGGGGIVSIANWWKSRKSRERGVSGVEHVAVSQAATPPVPLGTPDWEALTRYWQHELKELREEYRKHKLECAGTIKELEQEIDRLVSHIWRTTGDAPPAPTKEN